MNADDIAKELVANAAALQLEAETLASCFKKNQFFGDNRNFPHAHYGYLMACMGQLDVMSGCEAGNIKSRGQTDRMKSFMERYVDAAKLEEHRVAIQMMRHTLMHTGALRYIYDETTDTAYTWRLHFGDTFPATFQHYTLTVEDAAHQNHLISLMSHPPKTVKALNIQLTAMAADVRRVADTYTSSMLIDSELRRRCELVYPNIQVQTFKS